MPIASLIVKTLPKEIVNVIDSLKRSPQVSIYGKNDNGDVVVVVEAENSSQLEDLYEDLKGIEGVISVEPVYLYYEDELDKIYRKEIYPRTRFNKTQPE